MHWGKWLVVGPVFEDAVEVRLDHWLCVLEVDLGCRLWEVFGQNAESDAVQPADDRVMVDVG